VRGCIGAISLNYGCRIPIFRGRLRAPLGRTGHLGLPPRPLPFGAGGRPRRFGRAWQPRAQAGRAGNKDRDASRCGRDAERAELGVWLTTNRYQVIGSGLRHRWPGLNLSRISGAGCSPSITVAPMRLRDARPVAAHALASDVVPDEYRRDLLCKEYLRQAW